MSVRRAAGGAAEVGLAVTAAQRAFPRWAAMPRDERADLKPGERLVLLAGSDAIGTAEQMAVTWSGFAASVEAELGKRDATIQGLGAELQDAKSKASPIGDDLKRIRGIGPKFEQALKAMGVTTFDDIAAWTDADIDAVALKLKVHGSRIRRESWVSRAADLLWTRDP